MDEDFRQELLVRKDARAMANWNKLTEGQFKAIKTLLRGGATQKEAAEYMQVSPTTAFLVSKAETFEEYQHIKAERHLEHKRVAAIKAKEAEKTAAQETPTQPAAPQVVKEVHQTVTIQATHYMMQEMQKTNELLKTISAKLAFIVDELCGTSTKEG
jgi:hypothetical protein